MTVTALAKDAELIPPYRGCPRW
eukprot:COSAG01_NODE_69852_length_260_cov_0.639752_1_plen_22_part_01